MRSKPEVDPDVEVKEEVDDGSYNMALKVKLRHTKVRGQNKIKKKTICSRKREREKDVGKIESTKTNYVKNKCKKKVN